MGTRLRVGSAAGLLLALWFGVILVAHDGNPSTLLAVGREDARVTTYVSADLGSRFVPQDAWGHDGKFVFIQAHDPFLLDPDDHAAWLDAPVYRSQRVLVPALVGLGGAFGPWGIAWAFPISMVMAAATGAWATAGLAERSGRSAWWGMAFVANPGLFYSYRRGTVDVVAVALLVLGVYLATKGRYRVAGVVLAGAVLAKEVMIVGVLGLALGLRHDRGPAGPVVAWPAVSLVGWALYVRLRLGAPLWALGADGLTPPFAGVGRVLGGPPAPETWVALVILGTAGLAIATARRRASPAAAAAAGFAVVLPFLPGTVWTGYVDAWRAAAPMLALVVVTALEWGRDAAGVPGVETVRETQPTAA